MMVEQSAKGNLAITFGGGWCWLKQRTNNLYSPFAVEMFTKISADCIKYDPQRFLLLNGASQSLSPQGSNAGFPQKNKPNVQLFIFCFGLNLERQTLTLLCIQLVYCTPTFVV